LKGREKTRKNAEQENESAGKKRKKSGVAKGQSYTDLSIFILLRKNTERTPEILGKGRECYGQFRSLLLGGQKKSTSFDSQECKSL